MNAIWNRHRFQLNFGSHPNSVLQMEWHEFGEENFVFEILSEIKQDDENPVNYRQEAKQIKTMFIDELQPYDEKGYNPKITS